MPVNTKEIEYTREGIASKADRSRETSVPGYYSVPVTRYGVQAELTATTRVGFHRYSWDSASDGNAVIFDLENGGWDRVRSADIEVIDQTHIVGHRHSSGWADDQKIYFTAEFSVPFETMEKVGEHHYRFNFPGVKDLMLKVLNYGMLMLD